MKVYLFLVVSILSTFAESNIVKSNHESIANYVNSLKTTWKAYYDKSVTERYYGLLLKNTTELPLKVQQINENELPEEFDSSKHWPECANVIESIRDQSHCGSCWAFSATGAISDRICIHSKGQQKVFISAQDLDTCCSFECNNILGNCQGGDPLGGHRYYLEFGIVTGGLYKSNEGCIPYSLPNCSHHVHGSLPSCDTVKITVPTCTSQCEPSYKTPYHQDSHRGKEVYVLKSEQQIMADVIQNGPVSVAYTVFEDFEVYKEGIYRHVTGKQVGGHAVRLVGWGVENGVKYWKLANSWNAEWGEKGYFRMLRGVDECGIESQRVVASLPRL